MIDLHVHILPDFDDGAQSWEESLEMARLAAGDGIGTIVATPHILEPAKAHHRRILDAVAELQRRIDRLKIGVKVLPGAEIMIGLTLPGLAAEGRMMTIANGGLYLLVELPLNEAPLYTEQVLFELLARGMRPIIAHPERNADFCHDSRRLEKLIGEGCLTQISTGSLRGRFGSLPRKTAESYIARGMAHILATDGHAHMRRRPLMEECREMVAKRYGNETAALMTEEHPRLAIEGRSFVAPAIGQRRKILGWF